MYCPDCHAFRPEGVNYCEQCCTPLVKVKKGHLWPPIVIMGVLCTIGTAVFFLI